MDPLFQSTLPNLHAENLYKNLYIPNTIPDFVDIDLMLQLQNLSFI